MGANDNGSEAFTLKYEDGLVILTTMLEDGAPLEIGLADKDESCEIMCRFLAAMDYGDCP